MRSRRCSARPAGSVSREFYYNDAGAQINNLALSVQARVRAARRRRTIAIPRERLSRRVHSRHRAAVHRRAFVRSECGRPRRRCGGLPCASCARSRIAISRRSASSSTSTSSSRRSTPTAASTRRSSGSIAAGHTYEKDGALWLKTTDFGDDKDRVMRRSAEKGGEPTYFVPDVAYHITKWERGFHARDQRAGRRSSQHGDARARRPAGARHGDSGGLSRSTCCTRW